MYIKLFSNLNIVFSLKSNSFWSKIEFWNRLFNVVDKVIMEKVVIKPQYCHGMLHILITCLQKKKMLKKFDYHFYLKKNKVSMYQGIESQKKLWNSRSFILLTRKNEEIQSRKIKKFNMLFLIFLLWISTFFLIHKIKDQEFQK